MIASAPRLRSNWTARWGLAIALAMMTLVISACLGALWYVDVRGRHLIESQEQQAVDNELDLLVVIRREEGADGLLRELARRALAEEGQRHRIYALRDARGLVIVGNLGDWPADLGIDPATWRPSIQASTGRPIHITTRTLDDGGVLLAGRDDAAIDTFHRDLLDAVWIAVSVVAITCLAIAAAITAFVLQRVRRLSEVAARVADGDFSARARDAGGTGPFGEIALAQNTMLDRIEHLVIGLTTVTDSIAHDLRTPLARTRRLIEAGMLSDDPTARQAAFEDALAETDRTIATFTALIDISRAEGGLSREAMEEMDASALARDAYELFEPLAEERGVTIRLHADGPQIILGHRPLLMQAVSNLLHNAIKHAPGEGRVEIGVAGDDNAITLTVTDDGPGIAPDARAAAVQRFRRGAEAAPEGLGLGLAIVDACARLHRGQLILEDNGPGLRARLVLARR
jgi:signal transduction histidine kinase